MKTADTVAMQTGSLLPLPTQLSAVPVACVDIGGTKVAVSCVDSRGAHVRLTEATCKSGAPEALAQQVIRLVHQSCAAAHISAGDLAAVGVASCGPFVLQGGLIELAAPNICGGLTGIPGRLPNDWTSAPLEGLLRSAFNNVRIENDAVAALEAERRWGALREDNQPMANCAYVTWSTGVGAGLCVNGRILRGKNGNAGHAGHQFVSDNNHALCGCGNIGDVEALVGGMAIGLAIRPATRPVIRPVTRPVIGQRFSGADYASPAELFKAAQADDTAALDIVEGLCRIMGRMLYNLVATLDLQRISLGGSVFWHHREFLLPRLAMQLHGKLPALTDGCDLVSAGLGQQVGDYAALALALAATDQVESWGLKV